MRSKILFLSVGLILGYFLFRTSDKVETVAPVTETPAAPTTEQSLDDDEPTFASPQLGPALPRPRAPIDKAPESKPSSELRTTPKREVTLSFDETYLVALENSRVRDWAYTTRKPGGWEIHILDPGSPFSGMGIASGDFIQDSAIDAIRPDFRQRLVSILTQIEK